MPMVSRLLLAVLPLAMQASLAIADDAQLERFGRTRPKLGTLITIIIYAPDEAVAREALDAAFARIDALDEILSDYRADSELRRLCAAAPHAEAVAVSKELAEVLRLAQVVNEQSAGAFDVTVGPLSKLWRQARRSKKLPDRKEIQAALRLVGPKLFEVDDRADPTRVRLRKPGVVLDLGGVAKGFIVDEVLKTLGQSGIKSALVNAGGDIGVSAAPPKTSGWNVGVSSANTKGQPDRIVELCNAAVATSGDAFQSVTIDGVRYSHIVNPRTGIGLTRRSMVTVIAPTCAAADAWASALSVLGADGLERFPKKKNHHARILTAQSSAGLKLDETSGFPAGRLIQREKSPTDEQQ